MTSLTPGEQAQRAGVSLRLRIVAVDGVAEAVGAGSAAVLSAMPVGQRGVVAAGGVIRGTGLAEHANGRA